jgi:hypothetical protein
MLLYRPDRTVHSKRVMEPSDRGYLYARLMSTSDPVRPRSTVSQDQGDEGYYDPSSGSGWVLFAGTMLLMLAALNGIDGIAAVSNSKFYTAHANYILSDLNTYGWVLIIIAIIQGLVGIGVWMKVKSIRWFGVAIAAVNAVVQLMFIPAYPFWSLALFTLDILVIYGLIVHGARHQY